MRGSVGKLAFAGAGLSLVFWVVAPLTVSNTYIHAGQETMTAVFVALSLCALFGSVFIRVHPGWAAVLMGLGIIPGLGALVVPGLLLAIAALMVLELPPVEAEAARPAFRRSPAPRTRVAVRSMAQPSYTPPQPADVPLPSRAGEIVIYRASDGTEVSHCDGPDHSGNCPRPLADGTVLCAGCMLALPMVVRGSRAWDIPAAYRTCPVGSYDIFRQPAQPAQPAPSAV